MTITHSQDEQNTYPVTDTALQALHELFYFMLKTIHELPMI